MLPIELRENPLGHRAAAHAVLEDLAVGEHVLRVYVGQQDIPVFVGIKRLIPSRVGDIGNVVAPVLEGTWAPVNVSVIGCCTDHRQLPVAILPHEAAGPVIQGSPEHPVFDGAQDHALDRASRRVGHLRQGLGDGKPLVEVHQGLNLIEIPYARALPVFLRRVRRAVGLESPRRHGPEVPFDPRRIGRMTAHGVED